MTVEDNQTSRILVADDSPTISSMLVFMLESQGYDVITAQDGVEAISATFQHRPDLILLDIEMPRMNGYQACRLLKDDANTKRIPIIMLTSKDQKSDRFWGLSTGANDYLTKDFEPEELFALIERCLTKQPDQGKSEEPPKKAPDIGESDMLERVNNLLDRRLFQTTILNEVAQIAKSIHDHRAVVRRVLEFLYRVLDYQLAGMLLVKEGAPEMMLVRNGELAPAEEDRFRDYLLSQWRNQAGQTFPAGEVERIAVELDGGSSGLKGSIADMLSVPLEVRGKLLGIMGVATPKPGGFTEDNRQTLSLIANHGVVVVDNAILYAITERLAITDGLTGLYNHRYFKSELRKEVDRCKRFRQTLSLMILDIDFFKSFNDTYGHPQGDVLLRIISNIIRESVRDVDIVARHGGEEFAVILLDADRETALEVAERVRSGVEENVFVVADGTEVRKTISIGLATCTDPTRLDAAAIFQCADDALYRAKEGGRNRIVADRLA